MPIYEYICEDCKAHYERLVLSGSQDGACPKCGSSRTAQQFSVFAPLTGNGSSPSAKAEASAPASGCGCTPTTCGCH